MRLAVNTRSRTPRSWSSSPITIYINKLHHVAAITDRGQRQRQ
jgi:hypothetical protein